MAGFIEFCFFIHKNGDKSGGKLKVKSEKSKVFNALFIHRNDIHIKKA